MTTSTPEIPARSSQPLYRQVESYLREQIRSGSLSAGDMLPSVKELCGQFGGINHLTVRQAIKNLAEENLVRSVQGRGTFVNQKPARDHRIAIVLPHLEDTLFIRIAKGAQEASEAGGVRSLILDSRGSEMVESDHIQNLKSLPLDGALIFPLAGSNISEQIFKLKVDGFSFVLVDRYFEDITLPCVVADNFGGGYQSAKYLADKGRKRVAWIGEVRSSSARQRLEGLRAALNDSGIACPNSLLKIVEVAPGTSISYHQAMREGVHEAVHQLLQETEFDALVCCDDASALVALETLQEAGRRVPEEIALVGFDDIPEASLSNPPLTTVRQPMLQMGHEAAQMLLERMRKPDKPPRRQILPVELVVRAST